MKKLTTLLLGLCITVGVQAQKIIGFFPDYSTTGSISGTNWNYVTDAVFSFANPKSASNASIVNSTGSTFSSSLLSSLKTAAPSTKIHICVGGVGQATNLAGIAASSSLRSTFVTNVMNIVRGVTYPAIGKLAGVNLDWEFPETSTDIANHKILIQAFQTAIASAETSDGVNYELSIDVSGELTGSPSAATWIDPSVFSIVDWVGIMSYDAGYATYGNNHSSTDMMKDAVMGWNAMGCPFSKMVGGIAFYGIDVNRTNSSGVTYETLANYAGASTTYNTDHVTYSDGKTYYYNGKTIIEEKANYSCSMGMKGVLIWEVTQDLDKSSSYSIMNDLYTAMQSCGSHFPCTAPSPGEGQFLCSGTATLDAGIAAIGSRTFTWQKGGSTVGTGKTISVSSAGVYSVTVDSAGCQHTAYVNVGTAATTAITTTDGIFCTPSGSTTLSATSGTSCQTPLLWYAASSGGSSINSGTSYTTPTLTTTTTYYVGPTQVSGTAGELANLTTLGGGNGKYEDFSTKQRVATFTANEDIVIGNITVYPYKKINSKFVLSIKASDGTTEIGRYEGLINVPVTSTSATFNVGIAVPKGTGYRFDFSETATELWIENDIQTYGSVSKSYPYSSSCLMNLTYPKVDWSSPYGDSYGDDGFFYGAPFNIGVKTPNSCRVAVTASSNPCTGIADISSENKILVYPNPSSELLNLNMEVTKGGQATINIYDLTGRNIYSGTQYLNEGKNLGSIDLSGVSEGAYLLNFTINGETTHQSFSVVK